MAWDIMYALSCCGHLGRTDQARATLARLQQEGLAPDWLYGVSREPFRDGRLREQLIKGLELALAVAA